MTYATATDALAALNGTPIANQTFAFLKQLASETSVHADGKVTVLYGQALDVGGSPSGLGTNVLTGDIASELKFDPDVRIIDKTAFADFTSSPDYLQAVARAFRCVWNDINNRNVTSPQLEAARAFLFDAQTGVWAEGSARFAGETKGPIETLSYNANPTRVWSLTELPVALGNADVTTINGVSRSDLLRARVDLIAGGSSAEAADRAIFDHLNVLSGQRTANLDVKLSAGEVDQVGARDWLVKAGYGAIGSELPPGTAADKVTRPSALLAIDSTTGNVNPIRRAALQNGERVNDLVSHYAQERLDAAHLTSDPVAIGRATEGLSRANAAGMIMAVMLIATDAAAAEKAGDSAGAHAIVKDGLVALAEGAAIFGGIELAAAGIGALAGLPLGAFVGTALLVYGAYEAVRMLPTLAKSIANLVATDFLAARTVAPLRRDPLILDLDGDGLETIGINPAAPILFDHDGDGVKTATGWVRSDDAFLVLDRNGNNAIDNGSELFGDATNLYAGGKAADGFAALAQEDTNHDGKVDSLDARFANLRLWRDLNQDGISQSGELFTLASQGITALNVARTANATLLANGNQIADLGGFVRSNGTGGTLGAVEQLADINLASSPFYSQFTDSIPLTEAALNLADMQGAGMVRSLRQAASLPGAQGSALAAQLAAFAGEATRGGQIARLDSLLKAWSDTSTMATTATGAFAGVNLSLSFAGVANGSRAYQAWLDKLSILERFNGQTFLPVPAAGTTLAIDFHAAREAALDAAYTALKESVYGALVMQTRLKPYLDAIALSVTNDGIEFDFSEMEAALDARIGADGANGIVDWVEIVRIGGAQLKDAGWSGLDRLKARLDNPANAAAVDAARSALGSSYTSFGANPDLFIGSSGNDVVSDIGDNDTVLGGLGDDRITISGNNNLIDGGAGNDTLTAGYNLNTRIDGGAGDDLIQTSSQIYGYNINANTLSGGAGNDRIVMGGTADTYLFNRGDGQDAINEQGTNYWGYGVGADRIVFGAGIVAGDLVARRVGSNLVVRINDQANPAATDQITVENWFANDAYRIESFVFADSSSISKAQMNVLGNVQIGTDAADTLTNSFGDGVLDGGAGNDTLTAGYNLNTRIDGGAGDDLIQTSSQIYGYNINANTLSGGAGNDRIVMGGTADTYLFNRGDGLDAINEQGTNYWGYGVGADRIVFGAGIVAGDLVARRVGNNLIVRINDPANPAAPDQITVENWFANDAYRIETFVFADTSSISKAQMNVLGNVQIGTAAADTLTNSFGDGVLDGGAGNDTLTAGYNLNTRMDGGAGDDLIQASSQIYGYNINANTLSGGAGNDRIVMGGTADTYLFNRGDGQDAINEQGTNYWGYGVGADRIVFGAGIVAGDLVARRVGNNLIVRINDPANPAATDQITVENWFANDAYRIETFVFADTSSISKAQMNVLGNVQIGTAAADTLTNSFGDGVLDGGAGNDTLTAGYNLNTRMDGGAGDDLIQASSQIYGYNINANTLSGGTGNDRFVMGGTADTYLFNRGDGQDAINEQGTNYWGYGVGADRIVFGAGIVAGDLVARRVGNNLIVRINDPANPAATDQITVENWFANDAYRIETFVFADTSSISKAQMNVLGNVQIGTAAADTLTNSFGDGVLDGGAGNDTLTAGYNLNTRMDGGAGDDLIQASSQIYGYNINANTLSGGAGNDRIVMGGTADTYLFNRGDGQDAINEQGTNYWGYGVGADRIVFGSGIVAGDLVARRVGNNLIVRINDPANPAATDQITVENWFANDAYRIESFVFADTSSISKAQMNVLGNVQIGTAAADVLSDVVGDSVMYGGAGNDSLYGGEGNDILDGGPDADYLDGGTGIDTASYASATAAVSVSLGVTTAQNTLGSGTDTLLNIENLIGSAYDDTLTGNAGANTLGGDMGNDTYYVGMGDTVVEATNAGTDTVISDIAWALGSNLENLTLTGTAAINGTGNDLNNTLTGNAAANLLNGGAGDDTLDARAGADILQGGTGKDTYVVGRGYGGDIVRENDATVGNVDAAQFLAGIATNQLWFRHVGNNLEASIIGTTDKLTVENWYLGSACHVEQFKTSDGKLLLDSRVELLVQAMAAFAPPAAGQTTLPPTYQDTLAPVIAANWQ